MKQHLQKLVLLGLTITAAQPAGAVDISSLVSGENAKLLGKASLYIGAGWASHHYAAKLTAPLFPIKQIPHEASKELTKQLYSFNKDQNDAADDYARMFNGLVAKNSFIAMGETPSALNAVLLENVYDLYRAFDTARNAYNAKGWELLSKKTLVKTAFAFVSGFGGFVNAIFNSKINRKLNYGNLNLSPIGNATARSLRNRTIRAVFNEGNYVADALNCATGLTLKNNDENLVEDDVFYNEKLNKAFGDIGSIGGTLYYTWLKSLNAQT